MGGPAFAQLYIYALPRDQVDAALRAIARADFVPEDGSGHDPDQPRIALGTPYSCEDCNLDAAVTAGRLLVEAAPAAIVHAFTEPTEANLGRCLIHAPGPGTWTGPCGPSGTPVVPAAALHEALSASDLDLHESVRGLVGLRWTDAIVIARRVLQALPAPERIVYASPA